MKMSEIRELSDQELTERIDNEEQFFVKQKLNHAVSPLDNPNKLKETKKNIARLKTEKRAREIKVSQNS